MTNSEHTEQLALAHEQLLDNYEKVTQELSAVKKENAEFWRLKTKRELDENMFPEDLLVKQIRHVLTLRGTRFVIEKLRDELGAIAKPNGQDENYMAYKACNYLDKLLDKISQL